MANVETEQNASFVPSEGANSPASVAVIEENLAALLNAVTAPPGVPSAPAVLQDAAPMPASPVEVSSLLIESTSTAGQAPSTEQALTQEPPPAADFVDHLETLSKKDARPAESVPLIREITPVVDSQQEVVSKLALLSSIKQRRAVAMRPEFGHSPTADVEIPVPADSRVEAATASQRAEVPLSDDPRVEDQPALADPKSFDATEKALKAVLPTENIQRDQTDQKAPAETFSAPSIYPNRTSALFAPVEEQSSGGSKSFATSGAGLTLIAGSILGLCLIAYLFIGQAPKKPGSAVQSVAAVPVQTPHASAPPPAEIKGAAASEKPPAVAAAAAILPPAKKDEKTSRKVDAPQTAKPAVAPPPVNASVPASSDLTTPADANSAPVARAFTPPAPSAKPTVDTTIHEAPPALSATTTALPTVATLPSGIAPPPSPAKASGPREVIVPAKVQASKLARTVTPAYPSLAKTARVQGTVRFRVAIGTDGQVKGLMLLAGPSPLVQAAADAIKQWRYQPTIVNGEPVEVVTDIEVAFKL